MWPYYVLGVYIFVIVALISPKIGDKRNWKFFLIVIPLFLFAALRGNGNGDYWDYLNRGALIKSTEDIITKNNIGMEIGYRLISYIVLYLHLPRQCTVAIMNAISLFCMSWFIRKNSSNWSLSLLIFLPMYFQFDMHAARLAVAIGICAVGYQFIEQRKVVKYLICVVIASCFHSIAVVSIISYFLYGKKVPLNIGLLVLVIEIAVIRIIPINIIMNFAFSKLHLTYFLQKLLSYTASETYGYVLKLYDPRIWIPILIFILLKINNTNRNEKYVLMENGVYCNAFTIILFSNTTFFAYRISAFFYIYIVALVPTMILKYEINKKGKTVNRNNRIALFYMCTIFFTLLNMAYANGMIEYMTVFESKVGLMPY